jgi:hypothetical protein
VVDIRYVCEHNGDNVLTVVKELETRLVPHPEGGGALEGTDSGTLNDFQSHANSRPN